VFKNWAKAAHIARCGKEEPEELKIGDIWWCCNGGRDRKRVFNKHLTVKRNGKDPNRTFSRTMTLHVTEKSYKELVNSSYAI
jgi:hypothetical protein